MGRRNRSASAMLLLCVIATFTVMVLLLLEKAELTKDNTKREKQKILSMETVGEYDISHGRIGKSQKVIRKSIPLRGSRLFLLAVALLVSSRTVLSGWLYFIERKRDVLLWNVRLCEYIKRLDGKKKGLRSS